MKYRSLIIFFIVIYFTVNAQNDSINKIYIEDFNTYIRLLEETHPDPYTAFGGRIEFKREAQKTRNKMRFVANKEDFITILSNFTVQLEDGHTFINTSENKQTNNTNKFFPIVFDVAHDGLFIRLTSTEYFQYKGSKLLAINDTPIDSMLTRIKKLSPCENKYGGLLSLRNRISNEQHASAFLDQTSPVALTLKSLDGKTEHIEVFYNENPNWSTSSSKLSIKGNNKLLNGGLLENNSQIAYFAWNAIMSREVLECENSTSPHYQNLLNWALNLTNSRQLKDEQQTLSQIPELYKNFAQLLQEMGEQQSEFLIIDLRKNSGGMTPLIFPLLYMLYGDKYLIYKDKSQYVQRISPLLLQKWNVTADDWLSENGMVLGDYKFDSFLKSKVGQTIEEKRKDLSLITYKKRAGKEYTQNLNGKPIYEPKVIVVCSPQTFSAAYHFMYYLSEIGDATIVGVPSSQAGNTFMESTFFELPNTKTGGSISNAMQLMFPHNKEKERIFTPDFSMKWEDFLKYDFDENAELLYCLDLIKEGKIK